MAMRLQRWLLMLWLWQTQGGNLFVPRGGENAALPGPHREFPGVLAPGSGVYGGRQIARQSRNLSANQAFAEGSGGSRCGFRLAAYQNPSSIRIEEGNWRNATGMAASGTALVLRGGVELGHAMPMWQGVVVPQAQSSCTLSTNLTQVSAFVDENSGHADPHCIEVRREGQAQC